MGWHKQIKLPDGIKAKVINKGTAIEFEFDTHRDRLLDLQMLFSVAMNNRHLIHAIADGLDENATIGETQELFEAWERIVRKGIDRADQQWQRKKKELKL